ncbi:hypothetical protein AURDEDRAFT_128000 [Auricularia subglabra TFB-10046 SS5]|nr:hypothetical protein AURDEDRAFT_128000 [Auricularia subglabra TFB-10046 SS5]
MHASRKRRTSQELPRSPSDLKRPKTGQSVDDLSSSDAEPPDGGGFDQRTLPENSERVEPAFGKRAPGLHLGENRRDSAASSVSPLTQQNSGRGEDFGWTLPSVASLLSGVPQRLLAKRTVSSSRSASRSPPSLAHTSLLDALGLSSPSALRRSPSNIPAESTVESRAEMTAVNVPESDAAQPQTESLSTSSQDQHGSKTPDSRQGGALHAIPEYSALELAQSAGSTHVVATSPSPETSSQLSDSLKPQIDTTRPESPMVTTCSPVPEIAPPRPVPPQSGSPYENEHRIRVTDGEIFRAESQAMDSHRPSATTACIPGVPTASSFHPLVGNSSAWPTVTGSFKPSFMRVSPAYGGFSRLAGDIPTQSQSMGSAWPTEATGLPASTVTPSKSVVAPVSRDSHPEDPCLKRHPHGSQDLRSGGREASSPLLAPPGASENPYSRANAVSFLPRTLPILRGQPAREHPTAERSVQTGVTDDEQGVPPARSGIRDIWSAEVPLGAENPNFPDHAVQFGRATSHGHYPKAASVHTVYSTTDDMSLCSVPRGGESLDRDVRMVDANYGEARVLENAMSRRIQGDEQRRPIRTASSKSYQRQRREESPESFRFSTPSSLSAASDGRVPVSTTRERPQRREKDEPPAYVGFNLPHNRQPKDTPENRLHTAIRRAMRELLGFGIKNTPRCRPHPPADIDDILVFLEGGRGPILDELQLDLVTTADGVQSHWNIKAGTLFAIAFLERVANAHFAQDVFDKKDLNVANIKDIFLSKIRNFIALYQNLYFPLDEREEYELRAFRRKNSRRTSLAKLRLRMCFEHLYTFYPTFNRVDDEMISEDETDDELTKPGIKVVRRIERFWVNPEITLIFHQLLDPHLLETNAFGECGPGNKFRQRINHPPKRIVDDDVVVGLPKNFYNPLWLRTLSEGEIAELRARPSVSLEPFLSRLRSQLPAGAGFAAKGLLNAYESMIQA